MRRSFDAMNTSMSMTGSSASASVQYIRPPFPFPEAWPHVFQTQQATWLTPSYAPLPPPPPQSMFASAQRNSMVSAAFHPPPTPAPAPTPAFISSSTRVPPSMRQYRDGGNAFGIESDESDSSDSSDNNDDDDSDDGEYVYGYVLSDEWRTRFHRSMRARQQQKQQKQRQQQQQQRAQSSTAGKARGARGKKQRQQLVAHAHDQRLSALQRELVAAREREKTTRVPLEARASDSRCGAALADVRRLETQLTMRFDEFCDVFAPVVWPHD